MATGMLKIAHYSLVQASSAEHFEIAAKEFQKLMDKVMSVGYVPQGGLAYQCAVVNGSMLHILVQAVVQYEANGDHNGA